MNATLIVFYILAFIVIGSGVFLLNAKRNKHLAFAFVLVFLGIAGLYILLSAGVAAAIQIFAYAVGFSLMVWSVIKHMKNKDLPAPSPGRIRYLLALIGTVGFLVVLFFSSSYLSLEGGTYLYEPVAEKIETGFNTYIIPLILMVFIFIGALTALITLFKRNNDQELKSDE